MSLEKRGTNHESFSYLDKGRDYKGSSVEWGKHPPHLPARDVVLELVDQELLL